MLVYIILALAVLAIAASIYVRTRPLDAAALHVDPTQATAPSTPNAALMVGSSGSFVEDAPSIVAERVADIAEAEGATLLAGDPADGLVTYVARSRLMGFPDVISVKLTASGAGTQVDLFSRAIFGTSDLGVNTARAQRWFMAARGEGGS